MKRVYPLTKKNRTGGMTLYDQEVAVRESPRKGKGGKKTHNISLNNDDGIQTVDAYGTDGGNTSGEDYGAGDATITDPHNASIFKKTDMNKLNRSTFQKTATNDDFNAGGQDISQIVETKDPLTKSTLGQGAAYERYMPQSQLWFVNNRVSQVTANDAAGKKRHGSILPSVKVPLIGGKTSQDFHVSSNGVGNRRHKASSYRPSVGRYGGSTFNGLPDDDKSRNVTN